MKIEQTETLHKSELVIKGNEPFLLFGRTSLIVNLHDQSGQSHNFFQGPCEGIPFRFKNGDTLRFTLARVQVREIRWWENFKEKVRRFFK